VSFVLAVAPDGNYSALYRPVAVFIHQDEHLSYHHWLLDLQQGPMAVHRLRLRLHPELIATLILSVHSYWNRDADSQRPSPLFTSKMKYGHERH